MENYEVYLTEFEGLILYDAIEREQKLLEIVTAKEREAGNRDGWALARIKVRSLRSIVSQVVRGLPWTAGDGYRLRPEDEAELAERVAAVGQKMQPPRAELEKLMSVKARRRAVVRRTKTPASTSEAAIDGPASSAQIDEKAQKRRWTAPKCG